MNAELPSTTLHVMTSYLSYDAILFPEDSRLPHLIELIASPVSQTDLRTGQLILNSVLPHPEVHMNNIANNVDGKAWRYQVNKILDTNNGKLTAFAIMI